MHPYAWPLDAEEAAIAALALGGLFFLHSRRIAFAVAVLLLLLAFATPIHTIAVRYLVVAHFLQNVVVAEWVTTGTFRRDFRGKPANGRSFRRRGCAVAEVNGGKIVRYRDYYDRVTLLQQLDLLDLL